MKLSDAPFDSHVLWYLWRRKHALLLGIVAGAVIAGVLALVLPDRYQARAYVRTPGMTFAEYRKHATTFSEPQRLQKFLARPGAASPEVAAALSSLALSQDALGRAIRPFFAVTRSDVKELAEQFKDASTFVGFEVLVDYGDQSRALEAARLLVNYVWDALLGARLDDLLSERMLVAGTDIVKARTAEVKASNELETAMRKRDALREIQGKYPSAASAVGWQVISAQDGARYLPPVLQLVGAESQIVELTEALAKLRSDVERSELLIDVYRRATRSVQDAADARSRIKHVSAALAEVEKGNAGKKAAREAQLLVGSEIAQVELQFPDAIPFIGGDGPTIRWRSYRPLASAAVGAAFGFVVAFAVMLVLYWRRYMLPGISGERR